MFYCPPSNLTRSSFALSPRSGSPSPIRYWPHQPGDVLVIHKVLSRSSPSRRSRSPRRCLSGGTPPFTSRRNRARRARSGCSNAQARQSSRRIWIPYCTCDLRHLSQQMEDRPPCCANDDPPPITLQEEEGQCVTVDEDEVTDAHMGCGYDTDSEVGFPTYRARG